MEEGFIVLLSVVAFPLFWLFVIGSIAQFSGWRLLAREYAGEEPLELEKRHMCSLRIGNGLSGGSYGGIITIGVNEHGIWLRPIFPFNFRHPGLFLPFVEAKGEAVPGILGGRFEITLTRAPEVHLRLNESLGRWIEDTAMAQRRGEG